jgi:hypothetical protein
MRIAIDIDSTLHHYWDILAAACPPPLRRRAAYEDQVTWGITRLRPSSSRVCVEETHGEAAIAAARPYPGAVETVNAWAEAGHFIHITSHRHVRAHDATERWLHDIGLRFDELYCSFDKVSRCAEIGIDVLIDDSPVNLLAALERGIVPATIVHPWNRDVCEEEAEVRCARDWPGLARVLEPVLAGGGDHRHAA